MLTNSAAFDKTDVKAVFGDGAVLNLPDDWQCEGVRTNSKEVEKGNLFVALKGDKTDGHKYALDALDKGAAAVVASKRWFKENYDDVKDLRLIVVPDTLAGLGKLAKYHRKRIDVPAIAVAGSNGKTTTKRMIAHLLREKYNVMESPKNFNNKIGVPLTLFLLKEEHQVAVIEIGTNEPGEIAALSDITEPTAGLITNIGKEHLEKLKDLDGVEIEETFLFGFLHKTDRTAFINIDDERLKRYTVVIDNKITYGTSDEAHISGKIELDEKLRPTLNINAEDRSIKAEMKTFGYESGLNGLAATAVAFYAGLSEEQIKSGLESFETKKDEGFGRMSLEKVGGFNIINDCYNANPVSTKTALATLKQTPKEARKFAVLGDMLELGESSEEEHREIIKLAAESADEVILFGGEMKSGFENIAKPDNVKLTATKAEIIELISDKIKDGDYVLIKGSRGMKMEEAVAGLKNKFKD